MQFSSLMITQDMQSAMSDCHKELPMEEQPGQTPIGTGEDLYSVYFPTASKGFIVGGQGYIFRTINSGNSWTVDSSGTWNTLNSVFFTDSTTGYVVGQTGTILKTGNGGSDFVEEHKAASENFTLWPNPAKTVITITCSLPPQKELNVTIVDSREDEC